MKTEMQQYGYFQILVVNIVFFSFVWNLLLFLATYFGEPKFYTRSQFALWSSLYYGLRSLISLKRSRQDCRRLFCFIMSLLRQRLCLQEIRTSPFSQPLPHDSHSQKSLPHTTPVSSSSSSATLSTPAPTSQLGKRSVPINCNVGHNKKTLPPPPPVKTLQGLTLNICGIIPAKWLFIQGLSVFSSLDYIVLTEHQLSAEFRPDEIIKLRPIRPKLWKTTWGKKKQWLPITNLRFQTTHHHLPKNKKICFSKHAHPNSGPTPTCTPIMRGQGLKIQV